MAKCLLRPRVRALPLSLACGLSLIGGAHAQPNAEVFHWWTSPGESVAANVLRDHVRRAGVQLIDSPIVGGAGGPAMKTLRARVNAHNPPAAVQMLGFEVLEWGQRGALRDIEDVAKAERWSAVVPKEFQKFTQYQGKWSGVAANVHTTNWVWANRRVLAQAGITHAPRTWDEFMVAANKVKGLGLVALAYGGQAWQTAILFDSAVLAAGGSDFYRRVFIDGHASPKVLPTLERAFVKMTQLRGLIDAQSADRPWNLATSMVVNGKAAFQIMGDWAKPEFTTSGKQAGSDFLCFRVPGTEGNVTFNIDTFAMFRVEGTEKQEGQRLFAKVMMSPAFQAEFNAAKGSAPTRLDVPTALFDECGKRSIHDIAVAMKRRGLLGSIALGHALGSEQKDALTDIVHRHFNGAIGDKEAAAETLRVISR